MQRPVPDLLGPAGEGVVARAAPCDCTARCRPRCARWAGSPSSRASTRTSSTAARSPWPAPRSSWRVCAESVRTAHARGFTEDDERMLEADEARAMLAADSVLGGTFTPHCAAIHPARLVRGLARVVEALGVPVFEQTRVRRIEPGRVETDAGTVRAGIVLRATEGYTARLEGLRRTVAPVYSLMVATEPLDSATLDSIGLAGPTDVLRRPAPDHLRAAHRRRAARLRRARCALPLRVAHPFVVRRGAAGLRRPARRAPRDAPPARGRPVHAPVGRLPRDHARLGRLRRDSTGPAGSAGPAGTSVTGSARRTSPVARSPTW